MNTTQLPKKVTLTSVCCDTVITHDVSEEFTLPDYVAEVRKILFTRANVLPESKYISDTQGGASVDFGGTVTYFVIYTDDEGKLCSTPLSSNYEASMVIKGNPSEVFIDTVCDNVTTRVTAPRKLTIKTRLKSRALAFENKELEESISQKSSADELFIERLFEATSTLSLKSSSLQNIRMSEKFDTPSRKSLRPIICDAFACLKDVKVSSNSISCHGEVCVKCLCESEGELFTLTKTMPIYEEVECEGSSIGDMAGANVRCVSLSISSEENEDSCELFFDITCEIDAELFRNVENSLTKDCYSTKYDMEASLKSIDLYSAVKCSNASVSINESVKRKGKESVEIVDVIADSVLEKYEIKGECACIFGRLYANVIGKSKANDNGDFEYLSESYEVPFKYDCDLGKKCENPIVRVNFNTAVTSSKLSDDKFFLGAEIYPTISIIDRSSCQILDHATLKKDTEFKNDASCVRIFFPKNGDTLWEVAKKYHTTQAKIIEQNSLSDASLCGVKSIII